MKRLGAILAILIFICAAGCAKPPVSASPEHRAEVTIPSEEPPREHRNHAQNDIPAKKEAPAPKDAPAQKDATAPRLDAPWYAQRNKELRGMIHRYRPEEPEEQIEQTIQRMEISPDQPMVALTFDDGPVPGVTDKILDVLEQNNARATFFVCGWRLEKQENGDIIRRAASLGCEIGNHTYSHKKLVEQNFVSVRYELENTNDAVADAIGIKPRCFRPPGGVNTYEATSVTRDNGMVIVLWTQSGNVHETDPKKIAQNVQKQIVNGKELRDGDIILLHDTKQYMVDAVKIIVPMLQEQGYQLVTVWELLNCSGNPPVPGELYQRQ